MPEIFIKPKLKAIAGTKTTTSDAYTSVPDTESGLLYWFCRGFKTKYFVLSATTNNLLYSIDVSADGSNWFNIKTDQSLTTATKKSETHAEIWPYYRIQVKPAAAGQNGTITIAGEMSTL